MRPIYGPLVTPNRAPQLGFPWCMNQMEFSEKEFLYWPCFLGVLDVVTTQWSGQQAQ